MIKTNEVYEIAAGMKKEYRLDDDVMLVIKSALFDQLRSYLEKEEPYVEVEFLPVAVDAGARAAGIKTSRIDVRKTTLVLKKALQKAGVPVVGRDIVRQREKILADMAKKEDSPVKTVKRDKSADLADLREELERQKEEKDERLRRHQEEREIRMRREATEERIRFERTARNGREREKSWWVKVFGALSFGSDKTTNEKGLKK